MIEKIFSHKNTEIDALASYGITPSKHPDSTLIIGYIGKRKQWEQFFRCKYLDYQKMINIIYYFWEDTSKQSCYKLNPSNNSPHIFLTEKAIWLIQKYLDRKQDNSRQTQNIINKNTQKSSEIIHSTPYLTKKEITRIFAQHVNIGSNLWAEIYVAQAREAYRHLYCKNELGIPRENLQDFINFLDQKRHRYYRLTLIFKNEDIWLKYFNEEEFMNICCSCTDVPVRLADDYSEQYLVGVSLVEFKKIREKSIAYFKEKQKKFAFEKIMNTISSAQKQNRLKK